MKHVAPNEVIETHDAVLKRYGGCYGCPDPDRINALIARVRNYEYYEGMTDVFALAAMYWVAIAKGHAFTDGNKRTAVAISLLFLTRNGVHPYYRPDFEEIAIKVASDEMTAIQLATFLRSSFSD